MSSAYINCCGIAEMHGIQGADPKQALVDYLSSLAFIEDGSYDVNYRWVKYDKPKVTWDPIEPFIFFSDASKKKTYGRAMVAFLKKNKLGTVTKIATKRNNNSGNMLTMWVFTPNRSKLKKWYAKNQD